MSNGSVSGRSGNLGKSGFALFAFASCIPLLLAAPAHAAPADAHGDAVLDTVIVTAQKRKEDMQNVPVVVSALSAQQIERQGIAGTASLTAAIPGLVMANPANVGNPYLRGVGSNLFDPSSEQSVAMYVDGVYIASPQSNIFNFNNISDIEVFKGPQGTLFGRNATGGVIQISTQDPSSAPGGRFSVGYANYEDLTLSAYATAGLGDKAAIDLAALYENQGKGYGRNLTTGGETFREAIDDYSLRSKLLVTPFDGTRIVLEADISRATSTNAYQKPPGVHSAIDGSTYPGKYNTVGDLDNRNTVHTGGASIRWEQDVGRLKLLDILSYRRTQVTYVLDDDVTAVEAADVVLRPRSHDLTEELQLLSPSDGWLKWIVGVFYYQAKAGYSSVFIDRAKQLADDQDTRSYAGFGQATAQILPDTNLTLGARYTQEKQRYALTYPIALAASQSFSKATYRAAIDHHFGPDLMVFASYNTGFKSGGFNLLLPGNSFRPEYLSATEVGLKSELFDRRLRLNVNGFYYKDRDVQVLSAFQGGTITSNAAAATIKGVEMDFQVAPAGAFRVNGGLSVQRGHYDSYPGAIRIAPNGASGPPTSFAGNETLVTPHVSGSLSAENTWSTAIGDLTGSVTAVYNSGYYWQAENRLKQPAYTLWNSSLTWSPPGDRYRVRLWGKNLGGATYYIARLSVAGVGDVQEQAPPRTFGVTFDARF